VKSPFLACMHVGKKKTIQSALSLQSDTLFQPYFNMPFIMNSLVLR